MYFPFPTLQKYRETKFSDSKIIITPNAIHVTQFVKKYAYGFQTKRKKRHRQDKQSADIDIRSVWRARKNVRLLLESNAVPDTFNPGHAFRPLFVTLTFAENITDIKTANQHFKRFIQRLNYAVNQQTGFLSPVVLKYLVVPEFQKRGAVHYHIIFFSFPVQKDTNKFLSGVWGHGFTFNNTLKSVDHLKNYVTKYFVKNLTDPRLRGKKHYFCSKNIFRQQISQDKIQNDAIISALDAPDFEKTFLKDGEPVTYKVYNNHRLIPHIYGKLCYNDSEGASKLGQVPAPLLSSLPEKIKIQLPLMGS